MKAEGKGRNRREGGVEERGNTRPADPSFKNILLETKAPRIENSFVVSPTLRKKNISHYKKIYTQNTHEKIL